MRIQRVRRGTAGREEAGRRRQRKEREARLVAEGSVLPVFGGPSPALRGGREIWAVEGECTGLATPGRVAECDVEDEDSSTSSPSSTSFSDSQEAHATDSTATASDREDSDYAAYPPDKQGDEEVARSVEKRQRLQEALCDECDPDRRMALAQQLAEAEDTEARVIQRGEPCPKRHEAAAIQIQTRQRGILHARKEAERRRQGVVLIRSQARGVVSSAEGPGGSRIEVIRQVLPYMDTDMVSGAEGERKMAQHEAACHVLRQANDPDEAVREAAAVKIQARRRGAVARGEARYRSVRAALLRRLPDCGSPEAKSLEWSHREEYLEAKERHEMLVAYGLGRHPAVGLAEAACRACNVGARGRVSLMTLGTMLIGTPQQAFGDYCRGLALAPDDAASAAVLREEGSSGSGGMAGSHRELLLSQHQVECVASHYLRMPPPDPSVRRGVQYQRGLPDVPLSPDKASRRHRKGDSPGRTARGGGGSQPRRGREIPEVPADLSPPGTVRRGSPSMQASPF